MAPFRRRRRVAASAMPRGGADVGTLLVAGRWTAAADGTLDGAGALAAVAAAPLARTQCWGRSDAGIASQVRALAAQRGLDLAGVGDAGDDDLGELAPSAAEELGVVLCAGLDARSLESARRLLARLPPHALMIAGADVALLTAQAADADLIITTDAACRRAGLADPLAAAKRLQAAGARSVAITAGVYGGVLAYQGRATSWNAWPVETAVPGSLHPFAGALAAWCAGSGRGDFSTIKRGLGVASAVGSLAAQGGIRRLFASRRDDYLDRFNRLRRDAK